MKYGFHLFHIQFVTANTTMNDMLIYTFKFILSEKTVRGIKFLCEVSEDRRGDIFIQNNRIVELNK